MPRRFRQVIKARHRTTERVVALKTFPLKAVESAEAVKRFRREVRAAARLEHRNIVTACPYFSRSARERPRRPRRHDLWP
jgi:serine/threonine protein kinase